MHAAGADQEQDECLIKFARQNNQINLKLYVNILLILADNLRESNRFLMIVCFFSSTSTSRATTMKQPAPRPDLPKNPVTVPFLKKSIFKRRLKFLNFTKNFIKKLFSI